MRSIERLATILCATTILAGPALAPAMAQSGQADVLITGGTVYDGSTGKPFTGDVAIAGDKIVYVGPKAPMSGKQVVNAKGMIVSPGFIDPHTHADHFLDSKDKSERANPAWTMQGVSTVFTGVDGFGGPDVKALFARYTQQGVGTNVVYYVGFGGVRQLVIGDANRAPTPAELTKEEGLVKQGMCQGAIGLSGGLFYVPQSYSKTDEVVALAKEAAIRGGIYDTHQRDEGTYNIGLMASSREVLQIGREAHIPVHFSHIKALGQQVWGKSSELIKLIDDARAAGQNVTANQYPWLASHTTLSAVLVPGWAADGGAAAMIKRFDDPKLMPKLRSDMEASLKLRGGPASLLLTSDPWAGKYLSALAKQWNVDPIAATMRILRESKGEASVTSFVMSDQDVQNFMKQPWVVTSSDGADGHPREYATYPEKYLVYVKQKHVIDLGFFIRHSSGLTADMFHLDRRGYLRPGYFADVLVFNPDTYRPMADYVHPSVLSQGVEELYVNGVAAVDKGKPTGATPGRPLAHKPAGNC